ncbi:hypothetical protein VTH8203_00838 [Vibrio thalassae]|uniref:Type 4 secretion system PilS N-terminal domain-containing protein n=1 Tax=Vibrio thalassae TaxID=1243014 RepID=A0A240EEY3_9VIBR|nr:hypothetical protein [Vibrio thalassae]SNX47237.1 hypothetical protein VTH8203_00838 [Vibrio thalassae]
MQHTTLLKLKARRKGVTWVEASMGFLIMILVAMVILAGFQEGMFRFKKWQLNTQVTEINSGADTWKGLRSNFNGVNMTVICAAGQQSVSESTCGGVGGAGANANSFGGNFVLAPAANVSQKSLQITSLPADRINELADGLASMTAENCTQAQGCNSIIVAGTTITLTL